MRCTRTHGGLPTTTSNPPLAATSAKCVANENGSAPPAISAAATRAAALSSARSSSSTARVPRVERPTAAEQVAPARGNEHITPRIGDARRFADPAPRRRRRAQRGRARERACASARPRPVHNESAAASCRAAPGTRLLHDVVAGERVADADVAIEVRQRRDVRRIAGASSRSTIDSHSRSWQSHTAVGLMSTPKIDAVSVARRSSGTGRGSPSAERSAAIRSSAWTRKAPDPHAGSSRRRRASRPSATSRALRVDAYASLRRRHHAAARAGCRARASAPRRSRARPARAA